MHRAFLAGRGDRWWHRAGGYSLVELAVALAVVAVLLAAGMAGFWLAHAGEQADGWARSMTFDLSTGRQTGIAQRAAVTVTLTESSYRIATSAGATLRGETLPADLSISTTCRSSTCSFDRWGRPTTAGTITLTSASTGRSYVITIEPGTGDIWYQ